MRVQDADKLKLKVRPYRASARAGCAVRRNYRLRPGLGLNPGRRRGREVRYTLYYNSSATNTQLVLTHCCCTSNKSISIDNRETRTRPPLINPGYANALVRKYNVISIRSDLLATHNVGLPATRSTQCSTLTGTERQQQLL